MQNRFNPDFNSVLVNFFLARGRAIFQGDRTKYNSLIYKSTFSLLSFSSVSGRVAVAIGFLTRDPSLIWNTALSEAN